MNHTARTLLRTALDGLLRRFNLVVIDQTDYREAVKQAHTLWHYVTHSGHIANRLHSTRRIRSQTRRIAGRLGKPIWDD